ncbi:MAG: DUF2231 domain-containing protein [Jatrophihabitans sp.]|uniref:DUF2231 domain-containing protein n=1 Tax=Jatrophihabitans sp. TaxID=1932789 RepID=UPI003F7ED7F6
MMLAPLQKLVDAVEHAEVLDKVALPAQATIRKAMSGPVEPILGGEPIGHSLHPALVTVPIGAWVAGSVLDLTRGNERAARTVIGLGVLAALPTAATGAHDWAFLDPRTDPATRRAGLVHAALNYGALGLFAASYRARRRGGQKKAAALALVGHGVVGASGWLGTHLVYARGAGVQRPT